MAANILGISEATGGFDETSICAALAYWVAAFISAEVMYFALIKTSMSSRTPLWLASVIASPVALFREGITFVANALVTPLATVSVFGGGASPELLGGGVLLELPLPQAVRAANAQLLPMSVSVFVSIEIPWIFIYFLTRGFALETASGI